MLLYALTIFLSAFLLFQVQPLIGKCILPWFGGGPSVWTTCMLFFQTVLLAGYAYAHLVRTKLSERGQVIAHLCLLVVACVLLPIGPSVSLKPHGDDNPVWGILMVLASGVGLPYLALSATSPLLQAWFSMTHPGRSPYKLYALSNVGSFLALGTYPFLVEPNLRLGMQESTWSALFIAFVVLCAGCAVRLWQSLGAAVTVSADGAATMAAAGALADRPTVTPGAVEGAQPGAALPHVARPGVGRWILWLLLPACGSVMLLAITNQMCADVGVFPFLWILPLALYLLTFILCFESDRIYLRPAFWALLVYAAAGVVYLLYRGIEAPITLQIIGYSTALFVCCMVCHGELARLKPHPRHLTAFYLMVSAGGALGGVLVTLVAPRIFSGHFRLDLGAIDLAMPKFTTCYFELHIGLVACVVLAGAAFLYERWQRRDLWRSWATPAAAFAALTVAGGLSVALVKEAKKEVEDPLTVSRSFYGTLQVLDHNPDVPDWHYYSLQHGRILHGSQYIESEVLRHSPITYYGENSGIGMGILNRRPGGPLRIGVVGLGTGTMAAWTRPEDIVRFYEINEAVRELALTRFTYLSDCLGRREVVMGDARLSLERELAEGGSQEYDFIVLDAFSSDAIPIHLLTAEAFDLYFQHLKPNGVLAVHVSNRYLDLKPVVLGQADRLDMGVAIIDAGDEGRTELCASNWVLVTRDKEFLADDDIAAASSDRDDVKTRVRLWTDDYSDLFSIMNWGIRE